MSDGDYDSGDLEKGESCFAIVPDQDTAKPQRSYDVPHPSKRTKDQHHLAAYTMRVKRGDDDFEDGAATIGGAGTQRCCSTS